jgi:predicted ester cyclase
VPASKSACDPKRGRASPHRCVNILKARRSGVLAAALLPILGWVTAVVCAPADRADAETVVRGFLRDVRAGRDPDAASRYFAESVAAHQVQSEGVTTVQRTPREYATHVREFLATYGNYTFEIEELIAVGDRVFVRWKQTGRHLRSINGETPSGRPLIELASVVYRVAGGRIVEYWIQIDRKGLELQLAEETPK